MSDVYSNAVHPFADTKYEAAAIIARLEHGNLHAGIVYKRSKGTIHFLHLASGDNLENEWNFNPFCWAAPDAYPEKQALIGSWCQRILSLFNREKKRQIPVAMRKALLRYGLKFSQSHFGGDASIKWGDGATGLTCGTFILAVYNTVGIKLVDEETWPIRKAEDLMWAPTLPGGMGDSLLPEIKGGVARIRAEEVVGACTCDPPVNFTTCVPASEKVLQLLPLAAVPPVKTPVL